MSNLVPFSGFNHYWPWSVTDDFYDDFEFLFPNMIQAQSLLGLPTTRPSSDVYRVKVHVGGHYKPEEIKVSIDGDKLFVSGKHESKVGNGFNSSNFTREFKIPSDVLKETISHHITNDGVLLIEGKKQQPIVRQAFKDLSTKEQMNMGFDVQGQGFTPEEVKVTLHDQTRQLVVEANHHSKVDNDGKFHEQTRSFRKLVTIEPDVVLESIKPQFAKDGYLYVQAVRDASKAKLPASAKVLPISHQ